MTLIVTLWGVRLRIKSAVASEMQIMPSYKPYIHLSICVVNQYFARVFDVLCSVVTSIPFLYSNELVLPSIVMEINGSVQHQHLL